LLNERISFVFAAHYGTLKSVDYEKHLFLAENASKAFSINLSTFSLHNNVCH